MVDDLKALEYEANKHQFQELLQHLGHDIEVAAYGADPVANVAVECVTCHVVLVDRNNPDMEEEDGN